MGPVTAIAGWTHPALGDDDRGVGDRGVEAGRRRRPAPPDAPSLRAARSVSCCPCRCCVSDGRAGLFQMKR